MLDDFRDNEEDLNKGEEFLDEFRQRLNSQPLENLEERKNDINRAQHIFLGTVFGVGLAGIVSWFILSPDYNRAQDADIPVVRRPQIAVKVQPANPGGMEILNQDKTVYDIVEKKQTENDVKVENLLPPPEEPLTPEIAPEPEPQEIEATDTVINNAEKIIVAAEAKNTKTEKPTEPVKTVSIEVEDTIAAKEIQPEEKIEIKTTKEPQIKKEVKETKEQVNSAPIPVGRWQIQLISSPNKSTMEKAWNNLAQKYSELKNLPHEIESADLGRKGTFYRLKAGSFTDRSEADNLCNAIKAAGGSCLVKKK